MVDKDARVGAKPKTDRFFGYKNEFMMTTDERIITAVHVQSGEYTDGKEFDFLMQKTIGAGIEPKEIFGDKAYLRKDILDLIGAVKAEAVIPVSASAYKIDQERFCYNKDSDQWFCIMGNHTIRKKCITRKQHGKTENINCSPAYSRILCHQSKSENTGVYGKIQKKRSAQEWKNAEMKRFHGLACARGYRLGSVSTQAKLTAIAVNLKRIAPWLPKRPLFLLLFILD